MDKSQQKMVKQIHKETQQRHNDVLRNPTMTANEKKAHIEASKSERDAKLSGLLTSEQVATVKAKDPINWNGTVDKIDKQEKSRLSAERDMRLMEVDKELRGIEGQQDEIKKQLSDLKRKQKDLDDQQKALKLNRKSINAQYK